MFFVKHLLTTISDGGIISLFTVIFEGYHISIPITLSSKYPTVGISLNRYDFFDFLGRESYSLPLLLNFFCFKR